jgi:dipeptidyl aminopeptidase/acylaminoacyl peptidase
MVAASARRLGFVSLDADTAYWVEGRPDEGGRSVLMRRTADGRTEDVTPPGSNVRTRVHEYGGGAYAVAGGIVYYSEFTDQRLYRLRPGHGPEPLTPAGPWRYADATVSPSGAWLVCVREDHSRDGTEPVNTLVAVSLESASAAHHHAPSAQPRVIASGHDFFSTPRVNSSGTELCWLSWDHPRMPWDGTDLWTADVSPAGEIGPARHVAGGKAESIFQPGWSPDGTLYFVSDRSGYWNLHRLRSGQIEPVHAADMDMGHPQWQCGMSSWAVASPSTIAIGYQQHGHRRLGALDLETCTLTPVATAVEPGESLTATNGAAVFVGTSPTTPDRVVRVELSTGTTTVLRAASDRVLDEGYVALPEAIAFPTESDATAHAFFYAPRNLDHDAPPDERPPLIVISHGGPTAATTARLAMDVQFFTSRGFAVVDVNYGGSSGYGRAYRQRLVEQWGVVDVADCVRAATFLAERGRVDGNRLLIRGGSAGGFTTLAALAFRPGVFRAGASYYGVSDLEALARDTHKFEARYLDTLVGPLPAAADRYRARSPLHAADQIHCPVIFFQGLEDRAVPPSQTLAMAEAMRARGVRADVHTFEGEQHGFRKEDTIVQCLDAELAFYQSVLHIAAAPAR